MLGNSIGRFVLSANTGSFSGAVSGITTLATGNTTITGFANVTTTLQVGTNTATFGTAVYITASGNTGVGTSSPASPFHVKRGSNGTENYPTNTWAARVINATDANTENGLVVGNRWAAAESTVFEAGSIYGGGSAWASYYKVTGIGTHVWGTGSTGTEAMRINTSGILFVNTTSTPTYGLPKLVVDGNISGKGTVTINSTTATTIAEGAGLLLLIRDTTNGGSAVVLYENAQTPVIISTSGSTTFQTTTPSGSAQVQLASKSGNLGVSAKASGDRNDASLAVTVLQTFA